MREETDAGGNKVVTHQPETAIYRDSVNWALMQVHADDADWMDKFTAALDKRGLTIVYNKERLKPWHWRVVDGHNRLLPGWIVEKE